jgi:hypothetical protein
MVRFPKAEVARQAGGEVMKRPVSTGDCFLLGGKVWRVMEPYKVKHHWLAICEDQERVFSSGTIALHRVRSRLDASGDKMEGE